MATKIIAEVGVNHNGSIDLALELIKAAKSAGANSVKFQTFKSESLSNNLAPLAKYQKNKGSFTNQREMLKLLELSEQNIEKIAEFCNEIDIEFMSSPFGVKELHFLLDLGMRSIKIPSGEITNVLLLEEIGKYALQNDVQIFLSTGMSTLGDIERALAVLDFVKIKEKITILHCVSSYPAPISELNLNALKTLRKCFTCKVGYSDHSEDILAPVISVALGATVVEKHITIDKDLPGPDHKASITPDTFAEMVSQIRYCENMLGDGIKKVANSEYETKVVARRSIRASRNIKEGSLITEKDLFYKRPGDGLSPIYINKVVGSKASRNYRSGDLILDINF